MKNNIKFDNDKWHKSTQTIEFRHRAALGLVRQNSKILDIGCGDGLFMNLLIENEIKNVYGVDCSDAAIDKCVKKDLNVVKVDLSCEKLPYEDNFFDCVVALDVLEHTLKPEIFLKEMIRVSNHKLIIGVPNFSSFPARIQMFLGMVPENNIEKKGHAYWFNKKILENLLVKNGLQIEDIKFNYQLMTNGLFNPILNLLANTRPSLFALSFVVRAKKCL